MPLPPGEAPREPAAPVAGTVKSTIYMFSDPDGEIDGLDCVATFDSPEDFERWTKAAHEDGIKSGDDPDPEYWGSLRLWRVTMEEVPRPVPANGADPSHSASPEAKQK